MSVGEPLKHSILHNRFVNCLREDGQVDDQAYQSLREALRRLADAWRGERMIDKALAQDLYVLAPITFNVAARLRDSGDPRADEVEEMAIEIDALVLDCLDG